MNIGENICESIKIINEALLEGLHYDYTVQCTIVDVSKAELGEYRVNNGSTTFTAYSTAKFTNGAVVYVTIPNGDYNNDKLIIGKVVSESQQPFNYVAPFDNFLDISGNLVPQANNKQYGLLANDDRIDRDKDNSNGIQSGQSYKLFTITGDQLSESGGLSGFSRLGIRASFQSWLQDYNCIKGDYGLRVEVKFKGENDIQNEGNIFTYTKNLYLNTEDMIGNPYAYESFFPHEKLFNIDNFDTIIEINVYFEQAQGSFRDEYNNLIPVKDTDDEGLLDEVYLFDNLFVKDIWIAVGFDIQNQDGEFVQLYSFDAATYNPKVSNTENNKTIYLRWMHEDLNGKKYPITEDSTDSFKIHWYRYKLGNPPPDTYAGVNWEYINLEQDGTCGRRFSVTLQPDVTLAQEQVKVIILYGEGAEQEVYRSGIITFTNEVEVPSKATMEALSALVLKCFDENNNKEVYGNYLLYNEQNDLIDKSQANIIRRIEWDLSALAGNGYSDNNIWSITWQYPTENTMINVIVPEGAEKNGIIKIEDGTQIHNPFQYRIKNKYSISNSNNKITCTIVYNGIAYTAVQELTFGQAGTMGSKATFVIDWVNDQQAITIGDYTPLQVMARLYNENNEEVSDLSPYTIEWGWHTSPSTLNIGSDLISYTVNENNQWLCDLQSVDGLLINSCYILKATLKGWQNDGSNTSYNLIAYLPIPIRYSHNYAYIAGADRIVYLSDGAPEYYKSNYVIYKKDNEGKLTKAYTKWQLQVIYAKNDKGETITEENYYLPSLQQTRDNDLGEIYKLIPSPLYYEGSQSAFIVQYIDANNIVQWTQPILIIQSRYFSSMMNNWDGKTIHFDEEHGDILASRIGAGRKNKENQFSGVLLGDWGEKTDNSVSTQTTGLFGFRNGLLSFGFKDDGTAFIGTKAKGQLQFDGNESTITSASYRDGSAAGLLLDFDNPQLKMRQYSIDIIPYPTKEIITYKLYNTYKNKLAWEGRPKGFDLYQKLDNGEYAIFTSWSDTISADGIQLYRQFIETEEIAPIIGLTNSTTFLNKLNELGVNNLLTLKENPKGTNTIADNYDTVTAWDANKYNKDTIFYYPTNNIQKRTVELDATLNSSIPFKIGRNLSVGWDGTIEAKNGKFEGNITATGGEIKGELTVTGVLNGGYINGSTITGSSVDTSYLYADNGYIGGWTITQDTLQSNGVRLSSKSDPDNGIYNIYGGTIYGGSITGTTITGSSVTTTYLYADNGEVGGWQIGANTLTSQNGSVILNSAPSSSQYNITGGTIYGSTIYASTLTSPSGTVLLQGYLQVKDPTGQTTLGRLGYVQSGVNDTDPGIGMLYNLASVKATNLNAGLKYNENFVSAMSTEVMIGGNANKNTIRVFSNGGITIQGTTLTITGDSLNVTVPAENQYGIYARFA